MPFPNITDVEAGEPTRKDTFADPVLDALSFLNAQIGQAYPYNVPNGSFESGTEADTAPDGWDLSIAAGNSTAFVLAAATTRHGRQAFAMTTPGSISGGVVLTSTDFFLVSENLFYRLKWLSKSSAAGVLNTVKVKWYTEAEVIISTVTVFSSASNPTSWTPYAYKLSPPANARLMKIEVTGVNNSVAGTAYWDGFEFSEEPYYKVTAYVTGSGTHTFGPMTTKYRARLKGAGGLGGNGGAAGVADGLDGSDGANTTFGSATANGGKAGYGGKGFSPYLGGDGGNGFAGSYSAGVLNLGGRVGNRGENGPGTVSFDGRGGHICGTGYGSGGPGGSGSSGGGGGGSGGEAEETIATGEVIPGQTMSYAVGAGSGGLSRGGFVFIEEWA